MMKFFYSWLVVCALAVPASAQTPATLAEREATAVVDNPLLSKVESVRYLGTFINTLAAIHRPQTLLNAMDPTDFSGRMTQLRLMVVAADLAARTIVTFTDSPDENIKTSANAALLVFDQYRGIFGRNVTLYEDLLRILAPLHQPTENDGKALAESRITASKIAALYTENSDLLRDCAGLVFASAVVTAPNDSTRIALDMSAAQKAGFMKRLRQDFGDLEKQTTLAGPDAAAYVLMLLFQTDWLLAR